MPDPILWADGSLHPPAGGHHKESDPLISQLSTDARLPAEPDDQDLIEKRLALQANTSAKFMRAAHQAQTSLLRTRLFPCQDAEGNVVPADPITSRDPVPLQILKRLAKQIKELEDTPLDDEQGETELDRNVKIAQVLSLMSKQEAIMEQNINKAVGLGTRANQEAAKLQFAMRAHKDKMDRADGGLSAAEVEKIADG